MLLSDKQLEFVRGATHRWNFKGGATRSGKTYLDFKWVIPMRIRERIGQDGLVLLLGVTKATIERNVLEPMRGIYGEDLVGTISSDNKVVLFGQECYALGAEKVNQVSKIRGASVKYCYGDEVADWAQDVFQLLKSRLDKEYSCFDGTFNPQNPQHWLKTFLDSNADIFSQTYTIDDNPFISGTFKSNLKREYAGTVFYQRYILGRWVIAEGLIYSFDPKLHTTKKEPTGGKWYISIDYGTQNPCSMGLWNVQYNKAVRVDEYYYSGRDEKEQKTDEEYYTALEKLAGDRQIELVIVDPSAASFIASIRKHGRFSVRKAKNEVMDGIRITSAMLQSGKIAIHERCKSAIEEFGLYAWDAKSAEDKPIKEHDHAMDDIRYFCNTIMRRIIKRGAGNEI